MWGIPKDLRRFRDSFAEMSVQVAPLTSHFTLCFSSLKVFHSDAISGTFDTALRSDAISGTFDTALTRSSRAQKKQPVVTTSVRMLSTHLMTTFPSAIASWVHMRWDDHDEETGTRSVNSDTAHTAASPCSTQNAVQWSPRAKLRHCVM
jgi:hypothetical protein